MILLRDLSGNSAFKSGKRKVEALADELPIQQANASFGEEAVS